jgi:hypothetical protein
VKTLLLGEFSGLHKNLKEGLLELGIDVKIAGFEDGYKKIPIDINFSSHPNKYMDFFSKRINPIVTALNKDGYENIQLINPTVFQYRFFPSKKFLNLIRKNFPKFHMLSTGTDYYNMKYGMESLRYNPYDDYLKYDLKKKTNPFFIQKKKDMTDYIIHNVDKIIPVIYEYSEPYKFTNKLTECVPIPINSNKIEYSRNIIRGKIIIFHGLSRPGFKGTKYIKEAMDIIQERYPKEVRCIIKGGLPLSEYLSLLRKSNIVIDQCNSYSWGMNALYALAQGKIVLSGNEQEACIALNLKKSPIINIKPSVSNIVFELESLIRRKNEFEEIGFESRKFVEQNHNYINVAEKYLEIWKKS